MKRILSLVLVALLTLSVLCFTGCGAVNDSEVSILWSGDGVATNPNSLINSMERAMYIKHVEYKHYGANGDSLKQISQAKEALENGAQILVVELADPTGLLASQIVDAAKEKNVPVVFFNSNVSKSVVESYDKCVSIVTDITSVSDVQGELIAEYVKANKDDMDKNKDGKISAIVKGINLIAEAAVVKANELLKEEEISVEIEIKELLEAELILTADDITACSVLAELQEKDYNTDKLKTQFVPIFTVGENVDYKSLVLLTRPAIPENLVIGENDSKKVIKNKNKEIKKLAELNDHYFNNRFLCELTAVNESDLDEMIYTTINVIDAGRISGTVIEDRDAISLAVATVVSNFAKGNNALADVESKVKDGQIPSVVVDGPFVKVRYTSYSN